MIFLPKKSVIPLFGLNANHSFVPTKVPAAVARSGGQGRPPGRRASALPLRAASTAACLRSLGRVVCIEAVLALSMLSSSPVHAERSSLTDQQAAASPANPFAEFVTEASKRFAVPEYWIRAVIRVESRGKIRAQSRKGAMGLMQIMPETWTELRARYGFGADPYDPHDNICAGAAYIRELFDRYGAPGFLAAYNAGPGRYESHLATGRPLPGETQDYVARLVPEIGGRQAGAKIVTGAAPRAWAHSPLFVARFEDSSFGDRPSPDARPKRSSVVRPVVDLSALVPQSRDLFVHRARKVRSQ